MSSQVRPSDKLAAPVKGYVQKASKTSINPCPSITLSHRTCRTYVEREVGRDSRNHKFDHPQRLSLALWPNDRKAACSSTNGDTGT